MNPREQKLALFLLGGVVLVGLVFLSLNFFWWPLEETRKNIENLEGSNDRKAQQIRQIVKDQEKLRQWRILSLPGVESLPKAKGPSNPQQERDNARLLAEDKYGAYLNELLRKHKIAHDYPRKRTVNAKGVPQLPGGTPVYTPVSFNVDGKGQLENLVALLEDFQTSPLLQRIANLTIKHADTASAKAGASLALSMTVEALIVNGARKRGGNLMAIGQEAAAVDAALLAVQHRLLGLSAFPWQKIYAAAVSSRRNYGDIALKNIFEGRDWYGIAAIAAAEPKKAAAPVAPRETPDLISFACLTDATIASAPKATLFDRAAERGITLRVLPGYDNIPLLKSSEGGTVVRGKVLQIDTRGVIFHVQLFTQSPEEESVKQRYKKTDVIYSLMKDDVDGLVKAKTVKAQDAGHLYKVPKAFWEDLVRDQVVTAERGRFAFRWDLVRGRVLKSDANFVLIRPDDKYCSFVADEESDPVGPHAGYCFLGIGEKMSDGLQTPLAESEVRRVLATVAQREP